MIEKCWKCGMPLHTGGCNPTVFGPQEWQWPKKCDLCDAKDATLSALTEERDALQADVRAHKDAWEAERRINKTIRAEVERLMEMNQALTDCLNGSSKAVYTAEMYDDLRSRLEQAENELAAERGKVEKQYELIDFYDAKVAAVMKWRESAYIPDDSDENELKRILLGE